MHLCEPSIQVDWIPPPAFGAVVFNFPYVVVEGRRPRVDDNRELLVKFFASARRVLRPGGLVVVALARGQGGTPADATAGTRRDAYQNSWRILDAAARADLVLAAAGPPQFPGNYAPAGYRRRGADRRIADSYVKLSVAHVFRPEGSCMPRHAVEFAHDLSFWLPATAAVDDAFAVCPAMAPADGIDDAVEWTSVRHKLEVLGFTESDQQQMFRLFSAVLAIGNITFKPGAAADTHQVDGKDALAVREQVRRGVGKADRSLERLVLSVAQRVAAA